VIVVFRYRSDFGGAFPEHVCVWRADAGPGVDDPPPQREGQEGQAGSRTPTAPPPDERQQDGQLGQEHSHHGVQRRRGQHVRGDARTGAPRQRPATQKVTPNAW